MKTFVKISMVLGLILCAGNANAQFFKKLKERAKEAAERTIERKIEEKSERETEKAFDTIFNNQGKILKGKKGEIPEAYEFTHYYVMQVIQKGDTLETTSYFGEDPNTLGSEVEMSPDERVLSVIDLNNNQIHSFMDLGMEKTRTSIGFSPDKFTEVAEADDISIIPTGETKEILGYSCEAYEIAGSNFQGIVWVSAETPISLPDAFAQLSPSKGQAKNMNSWMTYFDGLAMEMDMTVTNRRKPQRVHMRCIDLGEANTIITTNEYQSAF